MNVRNALVPLVLMFMTVNAFTLEFVEEPEHKEQQHVQIEQPENEHHDIKICAIAGECWRGIRSVGHYIFDKLGTPGGATFLGVAYSAEQAVANFLWGFNWAEHADASDQANLIVQETGVMLVVAGNVVLGILIPIAIYSYQRKHRADNEDLAVDI